MAKMSADELIRAKIYRLEELRKYQAYYGPNTPYPVIVEINDLELELRRLLDAGKTRRNGPVNKKRPKKKVSKKKPSAPSWQFWRMSGATFDAVATIAFFGFVFLLASIVFAAYVSTRPGRAVGISYASSLDNASPTLRPTFTPTTEGVVTTGLSAAQVVAIENPDLPSAVKEPTPVATSVPSLTPTPTPMPTQTPLPTETAVPTNTPLPPPKPTPAPPAPPTPTPAPSFPFGVAEQGNRIFQKTSYHIITIYIAVVSEGNIPLGGYKVVADHSTGAHVESGLSDWHWSVANCLDCGYIKQGNLKVDLGPFSDGVWGLYLADPAGTPLSPTVPLTYSADSDQWVWDFLIFRRKSG